jgi:hypothetical protein
LSQEKESERFEVVRIARKKMVVGAIAASASLIVVLFLMAHAVHVSVPDSDERSSSTTKAKNQPSSVRIERLAQQYRTSAAGIAELEVTGTIRNTGPSSVQSADLKCHFKSDRSEDAFLEIPLIIPTHLPDVSGGPLDCFSARKFSVRIGDFPSGLQPEILDAKLVNIRFAAF